MTHDPVPNTTILPGLFRLWTRDPATPGHWNMTFLGVLEGINLAYADLFIHAPDLERLILPAEQRPCGPPKHPKDQQK